MIRAHKRPISMVQLFNLLDLDNNGSLTREEVVAGAAALKMTEEEAAKLFDQFDAVRDTVDW